MKVAVTWQMCGYVDIDKPTMEECMDYFNENCNDIELPMDNAEYVESSFELSSNDVSEMEAMSIAILKLEMHRYGYQWDGITPVNEKTALNLYNKGTTVYKLYPDNTEAEVDNIEDILKHDGLFGIESGK